MLVVRNLQGAYIEDFYTLEELNKYFEENKLDKKDYIISDKS